MFVAIGLAGGISCGGAALFANRRWGTVIACLPVVAWFATLGVVRRDGYSGVEASALASTLLGIVLGLALGMAVVQTCRGLQGSRRQHVRRPR